MPGDVYGSPVAHPGSLGPGEVASGPGLPAVGGAFPAAVDERSHRGPQVSAAGTGRALSPARQALSDQALALVRDAAPLPLSTTQVIEGLGERVTWYNTCGHADVCSDRAHWSSCPPRLLYNSDVVPLLRRWERMGVLERLVLGRVASPKGAHFWRYLGPTTDWAP